MEGETLQDVWDLEALMVDPEVLKVLEIETEQETETDTTGEWQISFKLFFLHYVIKLN